MEWNAQKKKVILPLIFLLLGITALANGIDQVIARIGIQKISTATTRYLETSFDKSVKGFLVLSTIKSGVAVLEGSEVGVGFSIQIGDLVQSIYDYVDIAWKTALAGSTILLLMRLMYLFIGTVDHYFLALFFFSCSGLLIFSLSFPGNGTLKRVLKEGVVFLAVINATLYLVLPLSISGAAFLSKKITQPLIDDATSGFSSLQDDLSSESLSKKLFDTGNEEDLISSFNIPRRIQKTRERVKETGIWLKEKTEEMAHWTIKLVAGYVFDCIIFPITFFFILFTFSKGIMHYIIGLRRDKSFKEDFLHIIEQYYRKDIHNNKDSQPRNT